MKKLISILIVFLMISASFTLYTPKVNAAAVDTCEVTGNNNYCIEVPSGKGFSEYGGCETRYLHNNRRASEVPNCKKGTCVPMEGKCQENKYKIECEYNHGKWSDQAMKDVQECKVGCCNVANSLCSIEQKNYCIKDLGGGKTDSFLWEGEDKLKCENECRKADLGCCVSSNGCEYGTRESCSDGEFKINTYCSQIISCALKPKVSVAPGKGTTVNDKFDCYYFDSAGNREEVAEDCDYPNKVCISSEEGAKCQTTDCIDAGQYTNPSHFRTGESLCVDIHPANFQNNMKSKYLKNYVFRCQWGEVVVDDSESAERSEVCIESKPDEKGNVHAKFVENKWRDCLECGGNGEVRDVFGLLPPPLSSSMLLVTGVKPCRGEGQSHLIRSEICGERGIIEGNQMCGLSDDDYDSDLWAPIGSCNPKYPPGISENQCKLCGEGGDKWANLCTEEECNMLGDCQFKPDGVFSKGTIATSFIYLGTCASVSVAALYLSGVPVTRETAQASAMAYCLGISESMIPAVIMTGIMMGYGYAASEAAQAPQYDFKFNLENGKADLVDVLMLSKQIEQAGETKLDYYWVSELAKLIVMTKGNPKTGDLEKFMAWVYTWGGKVVRLPLWITKLALTPVKSGLSWIFVRGTDKSTFEAAYISLQKKLGRNMLIENGVQRSIEEVAKTLSDEELEKAVPALQDQLERKAAKEILGKEVAKGISRTQLVLGGIAALWSAISLRESINTGKCIPEEPARNNKQCSLCGPGEGQPYCTKDRCGILGAYTVDNQDATDNIGHCKWVSKDTGKDDGICIPLQVDDTSPPKINYIKIKVYDPTNKLIEENEINSNKLDISKVLPWNTLSAKIEIKTNENADCRYAKEAGIKEYEQFGKSFDNTDSTKEHSTNITFEVFEKQQENRELTIYLRCQDLNGNSIEEDNNYIRLRFEPEPDIMPPVIKKIDPEPPQTFLPETKEKIQITLLAYDKTDVSECKYSEKESDYGKMENIFIKKEREGCPDTTKKDDCRKFVSNDINIKTGGTILEEEDIEKLAGGNLPKDVEGLRKFDFVIKCKDSQNNIMEEAKNLSLIILPSFNLTIKAPINGEKLYTFNPEIEVETESLAKCIYNLDKEEFSFGDYDYIHKITHEKALEVGSHTLEISCEDVGGNIAEKAITFSVQRDTLGPKITRVYTTGIFLVILTNKEAACKYSITNKKFSFKDTEENEVYPMVDTGKEHSANKELGSAFYILCQDNTPDKNLSPIYTIKP